MIVHLPTLRHSAHRKQALSLLEICDNDFTPPLSSSRLIDEPHATKIEKLNVYLSQKDPLHHYLLAFDGYKLIGLLNFIVTEDAIEIDTVCVHPSFRNQGIAHRFYAHLMIETCSTFGIDTIRVLCNKNAHGHIHLLHKLHFNSLSSQSDTHHLFMKKIRF